MGGGRNVRHCRRYPKYAYGDEYHNQRRQRRYFRRTEAAHFNCKAIAAKPKILMFDEATSALDNITQKIVSESLDKLKCTRIVIAHRLSTIKECSRIIVLDKGKNC